MEKVKVKVKGIEYDLDDKDALFIIVIQELTIAINRMRSNK